MKPNKIFGVLIPLLILGFFVYQRVELNEVVKSAHGTQKNDNDRLSQIIKHQKSGQILTVKGRVIKLLKDDNIGSKHQKLILKINKNTLLLAHNIDLAPRIPVSTGDTLTIHGEYQWNEKGGLIHWTHKDKNNHHENGWVKHKNIKYQ